MKREIKFRAWDKKANGWLNDLLKTDYTEDTYDANPYMKDEYYGKTGYFQAMFDTYNDRLVWQQFTGLKDKNGKDIYEGDILDADHYGIMEVIYDERHQRYLAYPREKGAMTVPDLFGNVWYANQFDYIYTKEERKDWLEIGAKPENECNVIGNIYENPELLK